MEKGKNYDIQTYTNVIAKQAVLIYMVYKDNEINKKKLKKAYYEYKIFSIWYFFLSKYTTQM